MVKKDNIYIGQSESTVSAYSFKNLNTTASIRNIVREMGGYTAGDAIFEMDLKINDPPVVKDALAGRRGFAFEVQNTVRRRLTLTADADGNILLNTLYHNPDDANGTTVSANSGKKIGDTIKLRGIFNDEHDMAIYIDDKYIHTFENIDYECSYQRTWFCLSAQYYDLVSGTSRDLDVEMLDFAMSTR